MKNNQAFTTALTVLLLFASSFVFGQQAEKTLVKSFNLGVYEAVALDVDVPVEVQTWSNSLLRFQINITIENGSDALLKSLVQAGRYNFRYKVEDDQYTIYAPDLDKLIKIGGNPLQDKVSLTVFAPEGVTVVLPEQALQPESEEEKSVN
jgi:hypothetical protein